MTNTDKNLNIIQVSNDKSFLYMFDKNNTLLNYGLSNNEETPIFDPCTEYKVFYYNNNEKDETLQLPDNINVLYYMNNIIAPPQINFT